MRALDYGIVQHPGAVEDWGGDQSDTTRLCHTHE